MEVKCGESVGLTTVRRRATAVSDEAGAVEGERESVRTEAWLGGAVVGVSGPYAIGALVAGQRGAMEGLLDEGN